MLVPEIVDSVDILEYISQFTTLERRSDGEWWGLSPLKDEQTPSFSVDEENQVFYDFSSGQGGNLLDFIRAQNHCSVYQAVCILKEFAGITDSPDGGPPKRLESTSIAKRFRNCKKNRKESVASPLSPTIMEQYPRDTSKMKVWADEGISYASMDRFQVRYDELSDRLVFPIKDVDGNIINISGRTLIPNYKERKLRKYTYFKPLGCLDTIYGFSDNREAILTRKEIILFEGAKSVLLADTWGITNTGAVLTSHLNPNQFKILIKLGVRVVFALDAEVDIRQDANIRKLLPYVPVEWVRNRDGLLDDKDSPVDKGPEVFKNLYERRSVLH